MTAILDGIRVLDLGRYVAGPYCATLLGYLGADVIRVERPGGGEDRFIAPLGDDDGGSVFMQTGCNKRSLTLNFRHEKSREVLDRLIESSDVVVANLPPAALEKLGLSWERISAMNPRIVLTTQTAFGTEGPWANRGGFDGVGQAMSGAAFMTGQPDAPAKAAAPYVDYSTAVLAAFGTLAELYDRQRSGKGQEVKASLLGTAMSVFASHLIEEGTTAIGRPPTGNRVQTSGPSDVFRTRDGHILIHVVGGGLFRRIADLVGANEWLDDPRFATDIGRGDHRDELCERVEAWTLKQSTDDALDKLAAAGVPAGPVLNLREAIEHPQARALGLMKDIAYPGRDGTSPVPDLPVTLGANAPGIQAPPPASSQHSDDILSELGYSGDEIAAIRRDGLLE